MSQHIYLHVGSHKTGTTAIQHWLAQNRDVLKEQGLLIPTSETRTSNNWRPHAIALTSEDIPLNARDAKVYRAFRQEVARHPHHDVILSAEYFSIAMMGRGLKFAANRLSRLNLVPSSCVFVRNPVDFLNSAYVQKTKRLNAAMPFSEFVQGFQEKRRADWNARLKRLEAVNLKPSVELYSSATIGKSIVKRLLANFGVLDRLPDDLDYTMRSENTSVGEVGVLCALELSRWLHQGDMSPRKGDRNFETRAQLWLADIMRPIIAPFDSQKFNGLSKTQAEKMIEELKPSLRKFSDKYLDGNLEALLASDTADLPQSPLALETAPAPQRKLVCELVHETVAQARKSEAFETFLPKDFAGTLPR